MNRNQSTGHFGSDSTGDVFAGLFVVTFTLLACALQVESRLVDAQIGEPAQEPVVVVELGRSASGKLELTGQVEGRPFVLDVAGCTGLSMGQKSKDVVVSLPLNSGFTPRQVQAAYSCASRVAGGAKVKISLTDR